MSTMAPADVRNTTASLLKRVKIRNYKSIAYCDVELGALTVLVGRNGAGKSNFLDALGFVADSLRGSLFEAMKSRGGVQNFCRKGAIDSGLKGFEIELDMDLMGGRRGVFGFEFGFRADFGYGILSERLVIKGADDIEIDSYEVKVGELEVKHGSRVAPKGMLALPPVSDDRLYLFNAAGLPPFRDAYDALRGMNFYQFKPESMKVMQAPNAGNEQVLDHDGGNIAGVIGRIGQERPGVKERILGYLQLILPDLVDVDRASFPRPGLETVKFTQKSSNGEPDLEFFAANMSDGTLRALGTLVAIAPPWEKRVPIRLVGVEEPETALHPSAAAALMDALREGAVQTQVIVTTHSPDLLDLVDLDTDRLLVVQNNGGKTEIGTVDAASRQIVEEHLYYPGQLLSMDQLEPDRLDLERQHATNFEAGSEHE